MDALIVLFAIIAIVNAVGSSKKKKEKQAQARAFQQAKRAQEQSARELTPAQRAQARRAKREAVEARRVRTPEDLQAHLAAMEAAAMAKPAAREEIPRRSAEARAGAPRPAEPLVAATVRSPLDGEGSVSTQGESEAEHAEHRLRAAAGEQARRLEREALRDLRAAKRERLQSAVIMSEILNKPVALRPRTGYHR